MTVLHLHLHVAPRYGLAAHTHTAETPPPFAPPPLGHADLGCDVIKTGMLPSAEAVALVARKVAEARRACMTAEGTHTRDDAPHAVASSDAATPPAPADTATPSDAGEKGSVVTATSTTSPRHAPTHSHSRPWLVVDPVLVSTSGHELAGGGVVGALMRDLMPLAQLVTPNVPEAQALLGECMGCMECKHA